MSAHSAFHCVNLVQCDSLVFDLNPRLATRVARHRRLKHREHRLWNLLHVSSGPPPMAQYQDRVAPLTGAIFSAYALTSSRSAAAITPERFLCERS